MAVTRVASSHWTFPYSVTSYESQEGGPVYFFERDPACAAIWTSESDAGLVLQGHAAEMHAAVGLAVCTAAQGGIVLAPLKPRTTVTCTPKQGTNDSEQVKLRASCGRHHLSLGMITLFRPWDAPGPQEAPVRPTWTARQLPIRYAKVITPPGCLSRREHGVLGVEYWLSRHPAPSFPAGFATLIGASPVAPAEAVSPDGPASFVLPGAERIRGGLRELHTREDCPGWIRDHIDPEGVVAASGAVSAAQWFDIAKRAYVLLGEGSVELWHDTHAHFPTWFYFPETWKVMAAALDGQGPRVSAARTQRLAELHDLATGICSLWIHAQGSMHPALASAWPSHPRVQRALSVWGDDLEMRVVRAMATFDRESSGSEGEGRVVGAFWREAGCLNDRISALAAAFPAQASEPPPTDPRVFALAQRAPWDLPRLRELQALAVEASDAAEGPWALLLAQETECPLVGTRTTAPAGRSRARALETLLEIHAPLAVTEDGEVVRYATCEPTRLADLVVPEGARVPDGYVTSLAEAVQTILTRFEADARRGTSEEVVEHTLEMLAILAPFPAPHGDRFIEFLRPALELRCGRGGADPKPRPFARESEV